MKKLNITKQTEIYIVAPANFATGGPELLHQLGYYLNKLGLKAFMFYQNIDSKNPVHPAYKDYNVPWVREIKDLKNNILIVPEVNTDIVYNYKYIQKIIWWLSVDNYYKRFESKNFVKSIVKQILYKIGYYKVYKFNPNEKILHCVQSEYARQHLIRKGINDVYFLGDYLNEYFIKKQTKNINREKKDIVVYNPKKGFEFTRKIIENAKDIEFIPIQNMTREEVAELLSIAKVYIDFGNHPGKDRIPREAAISGCCVITGKRGSAKYYEDVPIPDKYKFDDIEENIPRIIERIRYIMKNYDEAKKDFDEYREMIKNEQNKFVEDIKKIFNLGKI